MKIVKTACGICGLGCGVNVYLERERIVKLEGMPEHPLNRGMVCARARAITDYVYNPDRLKYPLKREGDTLKRISWDEALNIISSNLQSIKEKFGATSLAICFGQPLLTQGTATIGFIRRFCDVYGTPSVFSVDSMCWRSFIIGDILTFGKYPLPDPANSKCILLWAHNPTESKPMLARDILQAKKKGARLIVIDPRRIPLAKSAEIHLQPRPGTDLALMLGMLNVIISEELYDKEFVDKWTHGFPQLKEHLQEYTPQRIEKITWVPAEKIVETARIFATTRPACIANYCNTLEEQGSGVQLSRAKSILQAITGNFEIPGGFITTSNIPHNPLRLTEKMEQQPLGTDKFPLFYGFWGKVFGEGEGQTMLLPDTILEGKPYPVRAAIVSGSNPALTWPNSNKVTKAFQSLDFLVVMDFFLTETTRMAHIVLPAATCFERNVVFDFYRVLHGIPYVMLQKKIVSYEECWSDMKFYLELAKRMGYQEYFPWKTEEEVLDYIFQPAGFSVRTLGEEHPEGFSYGSVKLKTYEKKGFPTPSGKVEIYSETLKQLGHDPLPVYIEPPESPISTPELAAEYPLILISGPRKFPFIHSQLRNVPRLRKMAPDPYIEIHPETAAAFGVQGEDTVVLENRRGSIEAKVQVSADILPGVVSIAHGWAQANVNLMTDNAPADPISGFPQLKGVLCRVRRLSESKTEKG